MTLLVRLPPVPPFFFFFGPRWHFAFWEMASLSLLGQSFGSLLGRYGFSSRHGAQRCSPPPPPRSFCHHLPPPVFLADPHSIFPPLPFSFSGPKTSRNLDCAFHKGPPNDAVSPLKYFLDPRAYYLRPFPPFFEASFPPQEALNIGETAFWRDAVLQRPGRHFLLGPSTYPPCSCFFCHWEASPS